MVKTRGSNPQLHITQMKQQTESHSPQLIDTSPALHCIILKGDGQK